MEIVLGVLIGLLLVIRLWKWTEKQEYPWDWGERTNRDHQWEE